jgi:hypothetical protein
MEESAHYRGNERGYAAILSSPGAVTGQQLFGMSPVAGGGEKPVVIDPTTGTVTELTPTTTFASNDFDVVSSANTLYFVSPAFPNSCGRSMRRLASRRTPPA